MYDELVKQLRAQAVYLPEKFSKNAELLDVLMKAADAIEELLSKLNHDDAQIQSLVEAAEERRWIPVTERLPEKNQIVVAVQHGKTWDYGQFRGLAYPGGNIHKWNWKNNTTKTVDYWMPKKNALPDPPKEG